MNTTRRSFISGLAIAAVPVGASAAFPTEPRPTRQELEHYYSFLWCEFKALAEELGVEMHDSFTLHRSGGWEAYQQSCKTSPPSTRAKAILSMGRASA